MMLAFEQSVIVAADIFCSYTCISSFNCQNLWRLAETVFLLGNQ